MFDIVRRRQYRSWRVMIDSARILDSPFDDSIVCLSGAELELLRNLTQILHRQDTFVATYCANHYLTPDVDAWDAIQAIVAGLEEKLMGCVNLWFGYHDHYKEREYDGDAGAGTNDLETSNVPEGELWIVTSAEANNTGSGPTARLIDIDGGDGLYRLVADYDVAQGHPSMFQGEQILAEGEHLRGRFLSCTIGDNISFVVRGYKMKV